MCLSKSQFHVDEALYGSDYEWKIQSHQTILFNPSTYRLALQKNLSHQVNCLKIGSVLFARRRDQSNCKKTQSLHFKWKLFKKTIFKDWLPRYFKKKTHLRVFWRKISLSTFFNNMQVQTSNVHWRPEGLCESFTYLDSLVNEIFKLKKPDDVELTNEKSYGGKVTINSKILHDISKATRYMHTKNIGHFMTRFFNDLLHTQQWRQWRVNWFINIK